MKKLLISFVLALSCALAQAAVVQTVYLKNGTVLHGYIQQQDKKDNITFRSEHAVICITDRGTSTPEFSIEKREYRWAELDNKWQEWAEKNNACAGTGNDRKLTLSRILYHKINEPKVVDKAKKDSTKNVTVVGANFEKDFRDHLTSIERVRILEQGVHIKYIELTPNTYTFNWNEVETIKADPRPSAMLSGINREYILKDGTRVTGQYAGETYNTLSLYTDGGLIETYAIDQVTTYLYKPLNPDQTIFEQSELIDVVRMKDKQKFRGIIVERNFTAGHNHLVLQSRTGSLQTLKFADIVEYAKEENTTDYAPKLDIILKDGEFVINRQKVNTVNISRQGTIIVVDSISKAITLDRKDIKGRIVVEYGNPNNYTSQHLMLVKLTKIQDKKKGLLYTFSSDFFEMVKFDPVNTARSVNHTTRLEYEVLQPGTYALYNMSTKKAMPFVVK